MTKIYYIQEGLEYSDKYIARFAFTKKHKAIDYLKNNLDLVKDTKYPYWKVKHDPHNNDMRWWKIKELEIIE